MAMIQKENGYFLYSEEIGLKRFDLIRTQMSSEWTYFGTAFPLWKNISSREEFFQAPCLGELSREFDQSLPGDSITGNSVAGG